MPEKWKSVVGYEGLYEVSDLGRIRNNKGEIRKGYANNAGYLQICLIKNKNRKMPYIHRLVAEAFLGPVYEQVDHINAVRHDNRLVNLRLCTRRENQMFHCKSKNPGAWLVKSTGRYYAGISVNHKTIRLGLFDTPEEASARYFEEIAKLEKKKD